MKFHHGDKVAVGHRNGLVAQHRPPNCRCKETERCRCDQASTLLPQRVCATTAFASGAEQPHPAAPFAFASASSTQQASASAGAGPPQHPAFAASSATTLVEQTPVSGSTSRTSFAAASSPARCAAT